MSGMIQYPRHIGLIIPFLSVACLLFSIGGAYASNQADVVFVFDTTGSMSSSINSMKANAINFADALAASGIDYRLGLTEFKDFPNSCGGWCGDSGDFAYKTYNGGNLVSSATTFNAWISSLYADGGADWQESHLAALRHTVADQHWRGGTVQKVIVLISDAPPHADGDCCNVEGDTFSGTKNALKSNSVKVFIAGYDSGGNGVPNGWATDLATSTGGKYYPLGDLTPILEDISERIEAIEISPQDPTTMKDVTLNGVVNLPDKYEITGYLWTVEDKKTSSIEATGYTNPFTFRSAQGKYGDKTTEFRIAFKNKETGKMGVDVKSKPFKMFFDKGSDLNNPADDDNNGIPNWFEYWKKDGAVPNMGDAKYDGTKGGWGGTDANGFELRKAAAGVHYSTPYVLTTHFGTESFGGPDIKGIDCASETVAHERYHKEFYFDNWKSGGIFNGKTDSDKGLQASDCDDRLPDYYENDTSYTRNNDTDTYDLETLKNSDYRRYGDNEYMAMHAGNGKKGDSSRDWANPGKQTTIVYSPSPSAAKLLKVANQSPAQNNISGNYEDYAVDSNSNGFFDALKIAFDVEVKNTRSYDLIGILNDSSNQKIELVNNRFDLQAGINTVELDFNGLKINRHGTNGPYTFSIVLYDEEGILLDFHEDAYKTAAYNYTSFEGQQANLADSFADIAEDRTGDGIFDYLTIKANVDVKTGGRYTLEGYLYGEGDNSIAFAKTDASLAEGLNEVDLNFEGNSIAFGGWKGQYRLRYLSLYDELGTRLGFELDPYQTKEYDAEDFKPADVSLGDTADAGQDSNGDGFFEYLNISVGVHVSKAGNYSTEGELRDSQGNEIEKNDSQMYLDIGNHVVPLMYEGKTIYAHGVNGSFRLRNLLLYDESGTIKDFKEDAHTTGNYSYSDFKPLIALTGEYAESVEDTNGNSLFDNLVIKVGVEVAKSGNVVAKARLLDPSGNEILWASNTTWIDADKEDSKAIQLRFAGQEIYKHNANGPYLLSDLCVYHNDDPTFPDYASDVYATSAYGYQEFEPWVENYPPGRPSDPNGPTEGFVKTDYEYAVQSTDPDGDPVKYTFDWGDGTISETELMASGINASASHSWTKIGIYQVKAKATDSNTLDSEWSNTLGVNIVNRVPNMPDMPGGAVSGHAWVPYSYTTAATDPDGDQVKYTFDWGDGTTSEIDLMNSGLSASASHTWTKAGTYQVRVMATDGNGAQSEWSSSLTVAINANTPPTTPLKILGLKSGYTGTSYSYLTYAKDLDGDQIKYTFDWGDGTVSETSLIKLGAEASASHSWSNAGTYQVKAMATDSKGAPSTSWSSPLAVTIAERNPANNPPGTPTTPSGPTSGYIKRSYKYTTSGTDPDGDILKYTIDWGDGTTSETCEAKSGASAISYHAWSTAGTYQVRAMAIDRKGATSASWSDPLTVRIV